MVCHLEEEPAVSMMSASKSTSPAIVVVSSCMVDLVSYVSRLPKPGETLQGKRFSIGFGGKGANQSVAAAKLGGEVAVIAKLGEDYFGTDYLENFKQHNINVDYVTRTKEASTGVAPITVDESGQNSIIIVSGANLLLSENDIVKARSLIRSARVVVVGLETNLDASLEALKLADECNVISILNAAPGNANLSSEFLRYARFLCVNETEAELITDWPVTSIEEAKAATAKLTEMGSRCAIITLGKNGVVFRDKDSDVCIHEETKRVKAVDCTGAGDAFVGAFAYYIAYHSNLPLKEMIKRAGEIATASVLLPGTQSSYSNREDLPGELFVS